MTTEDHSSTAEILHLCSYRAGRQDCAAIGCEYEISMAHIAALRKEAAAEQQSSRPMPIPKMTILGKLAGGAENVVSLDVGPTIIRETARKLAASDAFMRETWFNRRRIAAAFDPSLEWTLPLLDLVGAELARLLATSANQNDTH